MHWRTRDVWKVGIVVAGMMLLVLLIIIITLVVGGHQTALAYQVTGRGAVQATPTVDVTAVMQDQLKQQDDKLQRENSGLWPFWLTISGSIGTIFVSIAAFITVMSGFNQWLGNRRDEQQKRAEERFQAVVEGLGSERVEAKVGATIMLRTFLQKGYEQFYSQAFDLAVAHLRLPRTSGPSEDDPDALHASPLSKDPDAPMSLTTLSQALIAVFKEAFPLARSQNKADWFQSLEKTGIQSLDATGIQLDSAYFAQADLNQAWMPKASFRKADLNYADLRGANLSKANFRGADLRGANLSSFIFSRIRFGGINFSMIMHPTNLSEVDLQEADLSKVNMRGANLRGANLREANLSEADLTESRFSWKNRYLKSSFEASHSTDLSGAKLIRANLKGVNLSGADLSGADLNGADLSRNKLSEIRFGRRYETSTATKLSGANFNKANLSEANLSEANLQDALSMEGTNLRGVIGLTKEQLEICKAKGAIIDEDLTTSSSQSSVSPPLPSQSTNAQTPSASPAQESLPTSNTAGNSAASHELGPQS